MFPPCIRSPDQREYEPFIYLLARRLGSFSLSGAAPGLCRNDFATLPVRSTHRQSVCLGFFITQRGVSCPESSSQIKFRFFGSVVFSLDLLASKKLSRALINPTVVAFLELNLPSFASGALVLMLFRRYVAGIKMYI